MARSQPRFPPPEERQSLRSWRPTTTSLIWVACAVLGVGGWLAIEWYNAGRVAAELDLRIDALHGEVERARAARAARAQVLADLDGERAAIEPLLRQMPCELGLDTLLPELRARLEPLGAQVRSELGWQREKDFYREAGVPLMLPERATAEQEARAALASLERLVQWLPWGDEARGRVLVVRAWKCATASRPLDEYRQLVDGRASVPWLLDAGVRRRERELDALREARQRDEAPLRDALLLERMRDDRRRLADVIAQLSATAGSSAAAP